MFELSIVHYRLFSFQFCCILNLSQERWGENKAKNQPEFLLFHIGAWDDGEHVDLWLRNGKIRHLPYFENIPSITRHFLLLSSTGKCVILNYKIPHNWANRIRVQIHRKIIENNTFPLFCKWKLPINRYKLAHATHFSRWHTQYCAGMPFAEFDCNLSKTPHQQLWKWTFEQTKQKY